MEVNYLANEKISIYFDQVLKIGSVVIDYPTNLILRDNHDLNNTTKGIIYPVFTTTSVINELNGAKAKCDLGIITDIFPKDYFNHQLSNYNWKIIYHVLYKNIRKVEVINYDFNKVADKWVFKTDFSEMLLSSKMESNPTDADMNIVAWIFSISSLEKFLNTSFVVNYGGSDTGIHQTISSFKIN